MISYRGLVGSANNESSPYGLSMNVLISPLFLKIVLLEINYWLKVFSLLLFLFTVVVCY